MLKSVLLTRYSTNCCIVKYIAKRVPSGYIIVMSVELCLVAVPFLFFREPWGVLVVRLPYLEKAMIYSGVSSLDLAIFGVDEFRKLATSNSIESSRVSRPELVTKLHENGIGKRAAVLPLGSGTGLLDMPISQRLCSFIGFLKDEISSLKEATLVAANLGHESEDLKRELEEVRECTVQCCYV